MVNSSIHLIPHCLTSHELFAEVKQKAATVFLTRASCRYQEMHASSIDSVCPAEILDIPMQTPYVCLKLQ